MYIKDIELKLKEWQFHQRKYLPYNLKLQLTRNRIHEWYEYWGGSVYISFSGGVDSTVLLHLVREELGNIPAVFSDTGLEYPELKQFVNTFENVTTIKPKVSFRQVIKKYGYPVISKETAAKIRKLRHGKLCDRYRNYLLNGDERGKMGKLANKWKFLVDAPFDTSEKCCDVMKKKPFKDYSKETGRYPFLGITQDESFMRQRLYEKSGCNLYDKDDPISKPMGFWTKQDVLRFAYENKLPIAPVYGEIVCEDGVYRTTGEQRTGCMFCMFGCHLEGTPNRFQRMEHTHPQLWEYCMRDFEKGGLGLGKVLDYVNIPYMDSVTAMKDSQGNQYQQYKLV